jgi:chromate transporter
VTETAAAAHPGPPVSLPALFLAFLHVSMLGFGGPVVWVRRILVDRRQWLGDQEFTDLLSFCSFMPGPNIVSMAVCVGSKFRGRSGALAVLAGFIIIPGTLGFAVGSLYLRYQHVDTVQGVLRGLAAAASGLIIATGLRLLLPHRRRPAALLFAALSFTGLAIVKLPLFVVVLGLVPLSIAAAWFEPAPRG